MKKGYLFLWVFILAFVLEYAMQSNGYERALRIGILWLFIFSSSFWIISRTGGGKKFF